MPPRLISEAVFFVLNHMDNIMDWPELEPKIENGQVIRVFKAGHAMGSKPMYVSHFLAKTSGSYERKNSNPGYDCNKKQKMQSGIIEHSVPQLNFN